MPFREKKAWVTIFSLLIVFCPYYFIMVQAYHQPDPSFRYLMHLAALSFVIFAALEVVLILIARKLSPEDAGIPKDEMEKLFAFKASKVAYVVLIILILIISTLMTHGPIGAWGWAMLYLGAIISSELLRAVALIVQYRRGF